MNEIQIKSETIRDYLLGRISDEKLLEQIEDRLFLDDEFCSRAELCEDELIDDYTFGKLNSADKPDFEKTLANNPERRSKVEFARALRQKVKPETPTVEERAGLFDSIRAFLPLYAGAFGVMLFAVFAPAVYLLWPDNTSDELATLENIYKQNRPFPARLSDFGYAPYIAERSKTTAPVEANKLRLVENKLLEAVENTQNAADHHALGVFYLTQKRFAEAILNLEKALEKDNAGYRNDLGTAYFEFAKNGDKRLESLARANQEFTRAFESDPGLNEALFNKSLVLEALNLPGQAKEFWKKYLERDSNSKWADEARRHLENLNRRLYPQNLPR